MKEGIKQSTLNHVKISVDNLQSPAAGGGVYMPIYSPAIHPLKTLSLGFPGSNELPASYWVL